MYCRKGKQKENNNIRTSNKTERKKEKGTFRLKNNNNKKNMSNNLAAYFGINPSSNSRSPGRPDADTDEDMGPSVSMARHAETDAEFEKNTFNLKRTRSMGLFDDYIDPTKKLTEEEKGKAKGRGGGGGERDSSMDKDSHTVRPTIRESGGDVSSVGSKVVTADTTVDISTQNMALSREANMFLGNADMGTSIEQQQQQQTGIINGATPSQAFPSGSNLSLDPDSGSSSNSESESDSESFTDSDSESNSDTEPPDRTPCSTSSSTSPPPPDTDNIFLPQDDTDAMREPERHVDYLSHAWKESEISNSWKYIVLKKKKRDTDLVNATRLENASWRTWAKARNHLKTVSPATVNWSKDSDITWLYGPIVRDNNNGNDLDDGDIQSTGDNDNKSSNNNNTNASSNDGNDEYERGYGSDDETSKRIAGTFNKVGGYRGNGTPTGRNVGNRSGKRLKPILKKRTVSEIIEENAQWRLNEARRHFLEMKLSRRRQDPNDIHDDYDMLAARVNAQYFDDEQLAIQRPGSSGSGGSSKTVRIVVEEPEDSGATVGGGTEISDESHAYSDKPSAALSSVTNSPYSSSRSGGDQSSMSPSEGSASPAFSISSILVSKDPRGRTFGRGPASREKSSKSDKHIRFNDRVEQCIILKDSDTDESSYEPEASVESNASGSNHSRRQAKHTASRLSSGDDVSSERSSDLSSTDSNDEDEDEDHDGLFINARFSRRPSNVASKPSVDGITAPSPGKPLRPRIKFLPATTLNYGSDEESDSSSIYSYGNAVSHNVNTQRGYDYIYDYNSVYTGDTSNFLPIDSIDILDVPEGISLETSIADSSKNSYQFEVGNAPTQNPSSTVDNAVDTGVLQTQSTLHQSESSVVSEDVDFNASDDPYLGPSSSDEVGREFIEDGEYPSSDYSTAGEDRSLNSSVEDDTVAEYKGVALQRTESASANRNAESFKDLVDIFSGRVHNQAISSEQNQSRPPELIHKVGSVTGGRRRHGAPIIPRRTSSGNNFIFDSDSDEEDSEEDSDDSETERRSPNRLFRVGGTTVGPAEPVAATIITRPKSPRHRLTPPQRTSSSSLLSINSNSSGSNVGTRGSSAEINGSLRIGANVAVPPEVTPTNVEGTVESIASQRDSLKKK